MDIPVDWLDSLIRLTVAAVLAALIGIDREFLSKPAGLRTHMLVALGSAGFTVVAFASVADFQEKGNGVSMDPIRIISGIAGGLGFLGAGTIIQARKNVYGMTTAAGIWVAGAIGVGCGADKYFEAITLAVFATICLVPIRHLERKLDLKKSNEESNSEQGANHG